MPYLTLNKAQIYYEIHGDGPETIVFSHGLLWSTKLFHKQIALFKNHFKCVVYDHRGQGKSEVTKAGYDMDNLATDAEELIRKLELAPCHFVGLSMGGFIAMRLAARKPDLVKSISLIETTADPEPNAFKYTLLNTIVKIFGVKAVTQKVMSIMFGKKFLTDPQRKDERKEWEKELEKNKKSIVKAVTGVIKRKGVFEELKDIECPALIMVGDLDVATVPAKSHRIKSQIKHSELVILKGAGHSSSIEEPNQVNRALKGFILGILQEEYSNKELE